MCPALIPNISNPGSDIGLLPLASDKSNDLEEIPYTGMNDDVTIEVLISMTELKALPDRSDDISYNLPGIEDV